MNAPLFHVFDSEDLALARQKEIDDASGYPCFVQGYTFPEGVPVPVWTEHAESVRAHPNGAQWAIAAVDTAELAPVEALDLPSPGAVDAPSASEPIEAGGGKVDPSGGKITPADAGPILLPDPVELDASWNAPAGAGD
jgi:hypothetical protein